MSRLLVFCVACVSASEKEEQARMNPAEFKSGFARMIIDGFDSDGDGMLSRDEVETYILQTAEKTMDDKERAGRLEGMMGMLDENSDGKGSMAELQSFAQKMMHMDGRTDRLPAGSGAPGALPAGSARRRKKKGKKKRAEVKDEM